MADQQGTGTKQKALWLFVSTIGELNAVQPLIEPLLAALGDPPLLLLTDRTTYTDAYRARHPQAQVQVLAGEWRDAMRLAAAHPPRMLLVAEIPGRLHDAPCRLSYATVHAAKQAGAPVVLINGWLYGYTPPSMMDRIEHALFARNYIQAFDLLLVQTDDVRQALLAAGARADCTVVTGNLKFDAVQQSPAASGPHAALRDALLARRGGPVVVAGSVTELANQRMVVNAFLALRAAHPQALLVLAPRHPENTQRMADLGALLDTSGTPWCRRSQCANVADAVRGPVLVLDTMGELRGCYAAATLAYVGTDHNVLEPLAFGKPVVVSGHWESTYPSHPVYRQLLDARVLRHVNSADELAAAWATSMQFSPADFEREAARLVGLLADRRGVVGRNLRALREAGLLASDSAAVLAAAAPDQGAGAASARR